MSATPATLPRGELVGLPVRVVEATDPGLVGIEGRVVRETTSTLVVRSAGSAERGDAESVGRDGDVAARDAADADRGAGNGATRDRQVPKRGATLEFALPDDAGRTIPSAGAAASAPSAGESAAAAFDDAATRVRVDGARLEARPAERTETTGDTTWR